MPWLFLASVILNGYIALRGVFCGVHYKKLIIPYSFIIGAFLTVTPLFILTSYGTHNLSVSLWLYAIALPGIYTYAFTRFTGPDPTGKKALIIEFCLFVLLFLFSWYICTRTISYDRNAGTFLIASNVYMDFGAHIPFIRSFSRGANYPAEVPFFTGSVGSYYFAPDFFAGILEYLGLRLDYAVNVISSLALAGLGTAVYVLATDIFTNAGIGLLSVVLFFTNSSLLWVQFFKNHRDPKTWLSSVWRLDRYLEGSRLFWDPAVQIAVFWNLNTLMNQRQLIFALALVVWFVTRALSRRPRSRSASAMLTEGVLLGFLPYWHMHLFIAACLFFFCRFILIPADRRNVLYTGLIASMVSLPVFRGLAGIQGGPVFAPGFLVQPFHPDMWIRFWFVNTGILIPVALMGMIATWKRYKVLWVYTIVLFLIPNVIHISGRNIFDDHKILVLWKLCMGIAAGAALHRLWSMKRIFRIVVTVCTVFLVLSGLMDFFVIKNDVYAQVPDYTSYPLMQYVARTVPVSHGFVSNGEIYDPVSVIGRRTLAGRAHFLYIYGGNPDIPTAVKTKILTGTHSEDEIRLLRLKKIDYIVCYSDPGVPNTAMCDAAKLTSLYHLLYTDSFGSVWSMDTL